MSNTVNKAHIATVVGHAICSKTFAEQLQKDPAAAAKSVKVDLNTAEISAIKGINMSQLATAGSSIRGQLGDAAILDQQQQQARMD